MVNENIKNKFEIRQKKYNEIKQKLDEEVQILINLLQCDNILYVDIRTPYNKIQNYKELLKTLEYELELYSYD